MDCSIIPTKFPHIFQISTTDFFYPIVDDPYMQGKIAAANVLSDLYSLGVVECDNVLMLLAMSTEMTNLERDVVTKLMISGFNDAVNLAESKVTGGQTVLNPWPTIGGVAMVALNESDFIVPESARPGDVIVLTKPIGTQISVLLNQWIEDPNQWSKYQNIFSREKVKELYNYTMLSMARLNKTGAKLMHKYNAHGCTDVTGFGLLGHADNLAKNQKENVNFEIHSLPIIEGFDEIGKISPGLKLLQGYSPETSGGLLITLAEENAQAFCHEIQQIDECPAWIIGRVVKSDKSREFNEAKIIDNPKIIRVSPNLSKIY
eukprot:TRINITY_DN828_c0_g1_i4.p1 TRINITY_DN828_c0_g1~~TRINITY_DN828_c0_g1_i4.p1  ORF type:complete len:318 (+),score=136.94 TRINITY_DN828_c0_g1_i4:267-1220(+)